MNADEFDQAIHLIKAAQEICRSGAGHEPWNISEALDILDEDEDELTAWNAREALGCLTAEDFHHNVQVYNKPYRTNALRTCLEEAIDLLQEIADSADEDEKTDND